ncbi:hypothetical protein BJX61DRAFT_364309 [Aspergillus egyptiacus]|nr:hypothetical protein BJX61DRAFT_364309 [Aspergillus egyptiacus]
MMDPRKDHDAPLSDRDKRILNLYGKIPCGGSLGQQTKKRIYFDSGDFALSAAHRETDNGEIQTGTAHPVRESISHPYTAIPNTSNASRGADKGYFDNQSPKTEVARSPLGQEAGVEGEGVEKGEDGDGIS